MLKLDSPLELTPVFKPKVWGRRDLAPLYPDSWTTRRGRTLSSHYPRREGLEDERIGEVWLTDDEATFTNGPISGMTLAEACKAHGRELCGKTDAAGRFPILAKFLFTSDWLSVQVHPDDAFARVQEPGNVGKCEMWYIIALDAGSEILLGMKEGASRGDLEAAVRRGAAPDLLQRFIPEQGEALFVPPGTLHALGPGLTLFEAEQNSDVTYRLDDFGRKGLDGKPRPLHVEKALQVTRPDLPAQRGLPLFKSREAYGWRRFVVACPFFAVEEIQLKEIASYAGPSARVECFTVIAGEGRVETGAGWYAYRTGSIWLIPPATPFYRLVPEEPSRILKFYVPDLDRDFRGPLAAQGAAAEEIERLVFA